MNFYIGDSIDEINYLKKNAAFSDELLFYLIITLQKLEVNQCIFFRIDPYDDTVIRCDELEQIIECCGFINEHSLLDSYSGKDEGYEEIDDLIEIANNAMKIGKGLVSIGD